MDLVTGSAMRLLADELLLRLCEELDCVRLAQWQEAEVLSRRDLLVGARYSTPASQCCLSKQNEHAKPASTFNMGMRRAMTRCLHLGKAASTRVHSRPPKGDDRIDSHRAESRNHSGGETRNRKHDTSADERHRIGGGHAKQLRLDVPSSHERTRETDGRSNSK